MRYFVSKASYEEDPKAKIGGGSEGTVYPFPGDARACVKLFHPPDKGDRDGAALAAYRDRKIKAICGLGLTLPDQFTLPKLPVTDHAKGGKVIGFLMQRIPPGYHKLMKLLLPSFRDSEKLGLKDVIRLYALLFEDLAIVHKNGLVVGDVNLGCLLFRSDLKHAWVDTDSWGYPGYPCMATTEMFCHPDLYANLRQKGAFVPPEARHDRFAFTVALSLMALPGAHPFRMGAHPSVQGLQNRAQQGITIFDKTVAYPPMLPRPEALSDDLLQAIIERLKRQTDKALDPDTLRAFAETVIPCEKCGAQYYGRRSHCPQCFEKTTVDFAALVELLIRERFKMPGVLLWAQTVGDSLNMVCRVNDTVQIINLKPQGNPTIIRTAIPATAGAHYRFFGSCLAMCENPYAAAPVPIRLYRIEGTALRPMPNTSTNVLEGDGAVFDGSARFLYRTAGNTLLCCEPFGGSGTMMDTRVAQVYLSQTWFTVDRQAETDREVIFGYDRALRDWQWFVIRGTPDGKKFEHHTVDPLPLRARERLEDFVVYFNAASVLLVRKTTYRGSEFMRYSIIGLDGKILKDVCLSQDDEGFTAWSHLRGKLFQANSVLHVTPDGIVKHTLDKGTYTLMRDTAGVVTGDDRLLRWNSAVGIVRRDTVLTLQKKPGK